MVGIQLDLYLLHQLRLHACRFHLRLAYHLYRTCKTRIDVSTHIHVAELPAAQLAAHLEHIQVELLVLVGVENAAEIE